MKYCESVNTAEKNSEVASKEVGLDVSAEKSGCMSTYRAHIARKVTTKPIFFCAAAAHRGSRPPHSRSL